MDFEAVLEKEALLEELRCNTQSIWCVYIIVHPDVEQCVQVWSRAFRHKSICKHVLVSSGVN